MTEEAFVVIRLGLAFVFFWTGVMIFKDTKGWAEMLDKDWVKKLLPSSPEKAMKSVAIFDILLGIWLLSGIYIWVAALLGALHMLQVLAVVGINSPAYRDVSILASCIGLMLHTLP